MISIDPQLEEVARGDIPAHFTHVIGVSIAPSGRYAVVMLTTNEGAAIEFDETVAERSDGRWVGLFDGTPSSIVYVGDHREAILCNYANPLPSEVVRVVVRDRGEERVVPVENGYFFYIAWKQDTPGDDTTDPPPPELIRTEPH